MLEDERRWTILFAAASAVVGALVAVYDVSPEAPASLLVVSSIPVAVYLVRVWFPLVPAWITVPVAGLTQILAVIVDEAAEGHTFFVLNALFYAFFRDHNRMMTGLALAFVLPVPFTLYAYDLVDSDGWLFWTLGFLICAGFGHLAYGLRILTAELQEQRRETERQAVHRERQQIARDVHDIVGHSLSVVMLHLTAARRMVTESPGDAERGLRQAERVGREAMAEIRQTMALLVEADGESDAGSDVDPVPTLEDLEALVARYRDAGMDVRLRVDGDPTDLATRVGVAGYRIVQEALVNVTKHGARSAASVDVWVDGQPSPSEVERESATQTAEQRDRSQRHCLIRIDSTRRATVRVGAPSETEDRTRPGLGLVGMRERARSVGGTLSVGPPPGLPDAWRVEAVLPVVPGEQQR